MPSLDLHAVTSGGSVTTLAAISTIAAGGDGATVAGVPIAPGAILTHWGGITTIADVIEEIKLATQDMWDPINGEDFSFGTATGYLAALFNKATWIPYKTGQRQISMAQKTGAANNIGYTIDYSQSTPPVPTRAISKFVPNQINLSTVFGGALTAITWGNQAFAPTTSIPNGYYAILGCYVSALTNAALIRFRHADFGLFRPGFPVLDQSLTAVANAVLPKEETLLHQGEQFVFLSEKLRAPLCPVFRATNGGTGLSFDVLDIVADTPNVNVVIAKVADLNQTIS